MADIDQVRARAIASNLRKQLGGSNPVDTQLIDQLMIGALCTRLAMIERNIDERLALPS